MWRFRRFLFLIFYFESLLSKYNFFCFFLHPLLSKQLLFNHSLHLSFWFILTDAFMSMKTLFQVLAFVIYVCIQSLCWCSLLLLATSSAVSVLCPLHSIKYALIVLFLVFFICAMEAIEIKIQLIRSRVNNGSIYTRFIDIYAFAKIGKFLELVELFITFNWRSRFNYLITLMNYLSIKLMNRIWPHSDIIRSILLKR